MDQSFLTLSEHINYRKSLRIKQISVPLLFEKVWNGSRNLYGNGSKGFSGRWCEGHTVDNTGLALGPRGAEREKISISETPARDICIM